MKAKARSEQIQKFILESAGRLETDLTASVAKRFDISRQAVNGHVRKLVAAGELQQSGKTKGATYEVVRRKVIDLEHAIDSIHDEHAFWEDEVRRKIKLVSKGSNNAWSFAFTEMLNNVMSHSEGTKVRIQVSQSAVDTFIRIDDDGVGIFRKLQGGLGLPRKRDAVVELLKGRTTTDAANHTGLGVFYSWQLIDIFAIRSEELVFGRRSGWIEDSFVIDDLALRDGDRPGTSVFMVLGNDKPDGFLKDFFDKVAPDVDSSQPAIGTLLLHLAEEDGSPLVSRSQAKVLMARMEVYKTIVLDFAGIEFIGQGFADQIFRIFVRQHPEIKLETKHAGPSVKKMIRMAQDALHREKASS